MIPVYVNYMKPESIVRWLKGDDNRMPHVYFDIGLYGVKLQYGRPQWLGRFYKRLDKIKPSQKAPKRSVLIDDQATHITGEVK